MAIKYCYMPKKKILLFGSVPMSLTELQMAPAMIGAFVKKRGHRFQYHDINLKLFELCGGDDVTYINTTEFLQDKDNLPNNDLIVDLWQQFLISQFSTVDLLLINVFSVFSQIPALRIASLCRRHAPGVKIIMGGIGSHKQLLGGINEFNKIWAEKYFPLIQHTTFGKVCLENQVIDDWQPNVGLEILEKWIPMIPAMSYDQEFDFDDYQLDRYQWPLSGKSLPMLGSHGCVRQCSFCDVILHFPKYSFIEADALTKSIVKSYQQTGINRVQFMDSLINGSMSNFLKLLKNLSHAREQKWLPADFSWSGTYICRPRSSVLDEIHANLAMSGADNLIIGVETGSDRVRFEMEKKFTNADLLYELNAFGTHGIKTSGLFFPSWPTETLEDFYKTLDLFSALSKFGQQGTLDSVSLGSTGFAMIDGTPIDRSKDKIGLHQGPTPWLWTCDSNPELTFWETVRRRLLMAEWCEMMGIRLEEENRFRRYLAYNLSQNRDVVLDYTGYLDKEINVTRYLPPQTQHRLDITVVNCGSKPVTVLIEICGTGRSYHCEPGTQQISFEFERQLYQTESLIMRTVFDSQHQTLWQRYDDSGDYYDLHGVYLAKIVIDHKDITLWGWNQIVDVSWQTRKQLPDNYEQHCNSRCITSGMQLSINMHAYQSPHKYLLLRLFPEQNTDRCRIDDRLKSLWDTFIR